MKLSVVVPVYNSKDKLGELVKEIEAIAATNFKWEIIFVYDCGLSDSWEEIKKLVKIFPENVKGIKLTKNLGQHSALIYGLRICQGDFIATLDEDIQNNPADLLKLIFTQQSTGAQVIYGYAWDNGNGFIRNLLSQLLRVALFVGISGISYYYSSFRLLGKGIILRICEIQTRYPFIDGMLAGIPAKKGHVSVKRIKRIAGKSSYPIYKLINHTYKIIVEYTKLIDILISLITILFSAIFISEMFNNNTIFFNSIVLNIGIILLLCLISGIGLFFLRCYRKKVNVLDERFIIEII